MKKPLSIVPRWMPALFVMLIIYALSSQSGDNLPNFLDWDYLLKKMSHSIGYGLLALAYLHLLNNNKRRYLFAWLMAFAFSMTDEFHQSFVVGRHASIYDVIIFDNLGALASLLLHNMYFGKEEENVQ